MKKSRRDKIIEGQKRKDEWRDTILLAIGVLLIGSLGFYGIILFFSYFFVK